MYGVCIEGNFQIVLCKEVVCIEGNFQIVLCKEVVCIEGLSFVRRLSVQKGTFRLSFVGGCPLLECPLSGICMQWNLHSKKIMSGVFKIQSGSLSDGSHSNDSINEPKGAESTTTTSMPVAVESECDSGNENQIVHNETEALISDHDSN